MKIANFWQKFLVKLFCGSLFSNQIRKKWKKLNLFTKRIYKSIYVSNPSSADNCTSHKYIRYENVELIFYPKNCTGHLQTLDLGIFSVLKLQYRKWLGSQKLNGVVVSEEMAVLRVVELFSNLSDKCINYAWKLSGIKKFQTLESEKPEDINNELLIDDLNERLEELHFFENEL